MSSASTRSPANELVLKTSAIARRRFLPCLVGAVGLHASLTLLGLEGTTVHALAMQSDREHAVLVPIAVEAPKPGSGPAPGGGSEDPKPADALKAQPEQPSPVVEAPRVPVAAKDQNLPDLSDQVEADPKDDLSAAAEVLAAPRGPLLVRPARTTRIQSRKPTRTARVAAKQSALGSRSRGHGPGAHSGPGGSGAGWHRGSGNGVVTQPFAFGGPRGAFRAEVCFIPAWTNSLREVGRCRPQVVFFTNHLDVSPRKFNEGFPGITERTEWFAIRYRGTFRVRVSDYYKFRIVSDDGSLLHIDGHLIIDNDGQHPPAYKEATIPLEQGEHELFVEYYQGPRENIALQLFVAGSDGEQKLLGPVI